MEWKIRHEVAGARYQVVHYDGKTVELAVYARQIVRRGPDDTDKVVHEAYRQLVDCLHGKWQPTSAYHTQMMALVEAIPEDHRRWQQQQLADVSVFTEDPVVRRCLDPFFTMVDDRRSASLLILSAAAPADHLSVFLGRVLRYCVSSTGTLQVWDARLPFAVPEGPPLATPVLAHALALVIHSHMTSFSLNKSFVEIHPTLANTNRITYG